jgi:hypothetical protein
LTYLAIGLAVLWAGTIVAFVWYVRERDRHDYTEREALFERHSQERRELYQRIQAPQLAVAQASVTPTDGTPKYINPEDDEAIGEYLESRS